MKEVVSIIERVKKFITYCAQAIQYEKQSSSQTV